MSASPPTPAHAQEAPAPPGGTGRDANGRFTAGNKYGPGNPFARQTAQLRKALLEVVTPEEMRQVAFTLLLRAKTGNLAAIKLLFQYVIGKPAEGVDPDRLEVEEWKLAQESKVNVADLHETVQHMPAETANLLVRHAWPAAAETNYLAVARDELEAMDREDAQRARAQEEARAEANGGDGGGAAKPQAAPRRRAEANGDNGAGQEHPQGRKEPVRKGSPAGPRRKRKEANGHPAPRHSGPPGQRTEANGCNGARRDGGGP
jgi:hypothetical protein